MLGENIRRLRREKGFTQEELAVRLQVVRQTISKWEKNLFVPDAEMLQKISDVLETPVNKLLGAAVPPESDRNELAEQLARINEQLAVKNRRSKRIWTVIAVVFSVFILGNILLIVLGVAQFTTLKNATSVSMSMSAENPIYSQEEVEAAIDIVENHFRKNYKGCVLKSITYDEDITKSRGQEWAAQYEADEAIILLSEFTTDDRGGDGSLNPNSTYKDWQWILTRSNGERWTLQTWGY